MFVCAGSFICPCISVWQFFCICVSMQACVHSRCPALPLTPPLLPWMLRQHNGLSLFPRRLLREQLSGIKLCCKVNSPPDPATHHASQHNTTQHSTAQDMNPLLAEWRRCKDIYRAGDNKLILSTIRPFFSGRFPPDFFNIQCLFSCWTMRKQKNDHYLCCVYGPGLQQFDI